MNQKKLNSDVYKKYAPKIRCRYFFYSVNLLFDGCSWSPSPQKSLVFTNLKLPRCTESYPRCCKWKLWLLYSSKFKNFPEYSVGCHILIPSWFHNYNFIDIWWLTVISPLPDCCFNDYWLSKVSMKKMAEEIEKKMEERLDILNSNHVNLLVFKNTIIWP